MSTTDVVRIAQQGPAAEEEQGRLKADLQYLRKRGLLKASGELSYQGRKCGRCGAPLGRFYNTGASCTRCKHRVCRQCRIEVRGPADNKDVEWVCNVCYKIAEFHVATGKWMHDNSGSKGSIAGKTSPSPVEILKHSIRRAWTINGTLHYVTLRFNLLYQTALLCTHGSKLLQLSFNICLTIIN